MYGYVANVCILFKLIYVCVKANVATCVYRRFHRCAQVCMLVHVRARISVLISVCVCDMCHTFVMLNLEFSFYHTYVYAKNGGRTATGCLFCITR